MITITEEIKSQADEKIESLITGKYLKQSEMASKMGISYRTFWERRKKKNWTVKEIDIIINQL